MPELDPIFVSVKEAARILGVSPWLVTRRLNDNIIDGRYEGRKRLVSYSSLKDYAASLPTTAQVEAESA